LQSYNLRDTDLVSSRRERFDHCFVFKLQRILLSLETVAKTDKSFQSCHLQKKNVGPQCVQSQKRFVPQYGEIYALLSGHPGALTAGNPKAFAQQRLQIPPSKNNNFPIKSFHFPSLPP